MTPKDRKDLSYGILGEAIYDTESREWSFQRKLGLGNLPLAFLVARIANELQVELCKRQARLDLC